jgi:hypothetical protein
MKRITTNTEVISRSGEYNDCIERLGQGPYITIFILQSHLSNSGRLLARVAAKKPRNSLENIPLVVFLIHEVQIKFKGFHVEG